MSEHARESVSVRECVIFHVGVSAYVGVSVQGVVSAHVDMNVQVRVCYTVFDLGYLP